MPSTKHTLPSLSYHCNSVTEVSENRFFSPLKVRKLCSDVVNRCTPVSIGTLVPEIPELSSSNNPCLELDLCLNE